jgi:hypothetical protein
MARRKAITGRDENILFGGSSPVERTNFVNIKGGYEH